MPNFSVPYFLSDPSIMSARETYPVKNGRYNRSESVFDRDMTYKDVYNPNVAYPKVDNPTAYHALIRVNDDQLKQSLQYEKAKVDHKFGIGASDWVSRNLDQFTPDERLQLLYLIKNSPEPHNISPISGDMPTSTGEPVQMPTDVGGGRRG